MKRFIVNNLRHLLRSNAWIKTSALDHNHLHHLRSIIPRFIINNLRHLRSIA